MVYRNHTVNWVGHFHVLISWMLPWVLGDIPYWAPCKCQCIPFFVQSRSSDSMQGFLQDFTFWGGSWSFFFWGGGVTDFKTGLQETLAWSGGWPRAPDLCPWPVVRNHCPFLSASIQSSCRASLFFTWQSQDCNLFISLSRSKLDIYVNRKGMTGQNFVRASTSINIIKSYITVCTVISPC